VNVRGGGADPQNTIEDYHLDEAITDKGTREVPPPFPFFPTTREETSVPSSVSFQDGDNAETGMTFPLTIIDGDQLLPITERYFLGGLNSVRGFKARSLGPRRAILGRVPLGEVVAPGGGTSPLSGATQFAVLDLNGNGVIDRDETQVIGGNKYALFNLEYQFPLNKKVGLGGLIFFDGGQAFAEGEPIRIGDMRYSMGAGVRWRSPFGPLRFEWGFPLAKEEDEDASVFEFSVGSSF
jgi:outer membrane protein insertion porin family